ncbi:NAD(P)-binding protein [Mytilinidion resinicola]|uniref:NAD(P)-binding protein n=1 Tax=Mytilinidion resinicola TaxID=574789 RepID=A0A6A6Y827_9PEZI|nr:NAD(P)-binding protein [Mytilinidion resinicola]KAF2804124.1 NAD(P)-binding protein [Mytilinidion resinicola]
MATIQKKTVLITGCSTGGIGWAMTKVFLERGFHVFATARDPSKAADLSALSNVDILELDVTVPQTISQCKDTVTKRTGGKLDVLVNNAGVELQTPLLDVDITEAKKLYDVNVWGPLALVQAFAPLLIEAKGLVVNQSSIDAVLSMAWAGVFASSKAAQARLSETLRLEMEPLGVRVVTVMCGSVDTPMFGKPGGQMKLPETSYYYNVSDAAYKERMDHQGKAMKVDVLAAKLVKDILGGARGPIWRGALASLVQFITWAFPGWYVDKLVNGERGLEHVKRL